MRPRAFFRLLIGVAVLNSAAQAADTPLPCPPASAEAEADAERALALLKALRGRIAADPTLGLGQDARVWLDGDEIEVCTSVCQRTLPAGEGATRCRSECLR